MKYKIEGVNRMKEEVSKQDVQHLQLLRENIEKFMTCVGREFQGGQRVLDIAPQDHKGAKPFFPDSMVIDTLDIAPESGATYIADLCDSKKPVCIAQYDYIVCTEVLEHTKQPFDAVESIFQMLKGGGYAFVTTPFNFRIHGPLPDCWRFTEYGLRELFSKFEIIQLEALESKDRFLMPIQYTLIARKPL